MTYAPVAVFLYNRVDKLRMCLNALERNPLADKTDLFLFADGAKSEKESEAVGKVRHFIHNYKDISKFNKVIIIEQLQNLGLANSIIRGVTKVINEYQKVIVVEDDLIVTEDFLLYMNQALDYYSDMKEYGSISAYTYPLPELKNYNKDIYVTRKGECWGWGTWNDRWKDVDWEVSDFGFYLHDRKKRRDFDAIEKGLDKMLVLQQSGEIDSWAVRWCYHLFIKQLLTVYPRVSKTQNIGFDGSGTNCGSEEIVENRFNGDELYEEICWQEKKFIFERIGINKELEYKASVYAYVSFGRKVINKCKTLFGI